MTEYERGLVQPRTESVHRILNRMILPLQNQYFNPILPDPSHYPMQNFGNVQLWVPRLLSECLATFLGEMCKDELLPETPGWWFILPVQ